jgi:hypothetical protein
LRAALPARVAPVLVVVPVVVRATPGTAVAPVAALVLVVVPAAGLLPALVLAGTGLGEGRGREGGGGQRGENASDGDFRARAADACRGGEEHYSAFLLGTVGRRLMRAPPTPEATAARGAGIERAANS